MPELPEVETIVRGLRKAIRGQVIAGLEIKNTASIYPPDKNRFKKLLNGVTIGQIKRRGKNILIELSNNYTLWVHLKMTGHFYYLPKEEPTGKHDHIIFDLADNGYNLRFNDYRRFGRLRIYPTYEVLGQVGLADLGPEPLEIKAEDFVSLLKNRTRMIKPALLDQTFIAGLGNIYADESLFLSRLHPKRITSSISHKKLLELHGHTQNVLRRAIRNMGTSVYSYDGVNRETGKFQNYLMVYGHEGDPCPNCTHVIIREKIGSRSAHYCPRCQRLR